MSYWYHFAIMFEALFILTTVDTGTRVARYIAQDIFRLRGSIIPSALVVTAWGYLVYNGDIATIWPMFGVANQLLATTALVIGTTIILKSNKNKWYALITFLPMLFMLATTVTAGVENIFYNYLPQGTFNGTLNAFLSAIMLVLVLIIVVDASIKWAAFLQSHKGLNETRTKEKEPALELDI
jgi:carbon starvation protein